MSHQTLAITRRVRRVGLVAALVTACAGSLLLGAPPAAAAGAGPAGRPAVHVALGDSYSSGEANPPFHPAAPQCHRSPAAWPARVAARLDARLVQLACSGATTAALTGPHNGQQPQAGVLAAVRPFPDLVTLTIGGNDAGFAPTLAQCFLADCWELGGIAVAQVRIRLELPRRLADAYATVRAAAPQARLVVVGYPRLFPSRRSAVTGCAWLGAKEQAELNETADRLNRVIRRAARRAGATYVDVSRSLRGHELCTPDAWVYPVGEDLVLTSMAHPTANGQRAIAAAVAAAVGGH